MRERDPGWKRVPALFLGFLLHGYWLEGLHGTASGKPP